MYAVIYRLHLKPEKAAEYEKLWAIVADYFVKKRGAIGSCIHKTSEGLYVIYSRWPDKKTRDASWPGADAPSDELPAEVKQAVLAMRDCVDESFDKIPDLEMEVIGDKLLK